MKTVSWLSLGSREHGNEEKSVALVEADVAFAAMHGFDDSEALIADISKFGAGRFIDRGLYLLMYNLDCVVMAHGSNPRVIGIELWTTQDSDDKYFAATG